MLITNHLNLVGSVYDIRIVGDAFLFERPFHTLMPEPTFEPHVQHEASKHWRMKNWGVPYEPLNVELIDAFDHSLAIEFTTIGTEPSGLLKYMARQYPSLSGVCQFVADTHSIHNSGVVKLANGKTFARTYSKPNDIYKEYA